MRSRLTNWIAGSTLFGLLLTIGAPSTSLAQEGSTPAELSKIQRPILRKDAFLGLHFDLHPSKDDTSLGADIEEENIVALLEQVKPDYIQYDCKGHPGYTGYPTNIGWPSPGIVKDSLAIWRKLTRERGIGLFVHFSGVWDTVAIEHHPEWACLNVDGTPDDDRTSTFGPYVDKLMIPQLNEIAAKYDVDGAWVDGDCWAVKWDWSPAAIEAWKKETGYADVPKSREDVHWLEWKMFHRRQFEKYLCHWVDAVHAANPKMQLTSNWMYSTFAPKPVVAKLDFLSGDFPMRLSVNSARLEARYLASTGLPWDLLAWGKSRVKETDAGEETDAGSALKSALDLHQEAATVLMQGGGFEVYYNPTESGYIIPDIIQITRDVADFCRARQRVSHKSRSVPQVALLLSAETQFDRSDAVFHSRGGVLNETEGALHALLENHYSVDVLAEHQLQPRLSEFPLVVIPDSYKLPEDFKAALRQYVDDGGHLLLLGQQCARLFAADLGVRFEGSPQKEKAVLATSAGAIMEGGEWQKIVPTTAQVVAQRYPTWDIRNGGEVAATLTSRGHGKIVAVYGPLALNYFHTHHPTLRRFIGELAGKLLPDPAVRIAGPSCVDVSLRRTADGMLSVHLLNTAGMPLGEHQLTTDFIPPVGPVQVSLQVAEKPKNVVWIPEDQPLTWSWESGTLSVTIPTVHVHGVVLIIP